MFIKIHHYKLLRRKKEKNMVKIKKYFSSFLVILFFIIIIAILLKKYRSNKSNFFIYHNFNMTLNNKEKKYQKFIAILPKLKNETISNLTTIFQGRELFINGNNLTNEYIHFIRPLEEESKNNKKYENITPYEFINSSRKNQYNKTEFYNLCNEEKLIDSQNFEYSNDPLISIIVKSYNKRDIILKSIRSIQNQSLKNIEIIIVDDG